MMKRRGSKVDANKEHVLKRAMDKSSSNYKWIRHPGTEFNHLKKMNSSISNLGIKIIIKLQKDYLNLWIINPNWCPVAGGITSR